MKIKDVIKMANMMEKGNVLEPELAIFFLSELDGMIQSDIMLCAPEEIVSYDNQEQELLLKPPHDKLYVHYLVMMIRNQQQEYEGYQNSQKSVDEKLKTFKRWYIQHYRPADTASRSYSGGTSADAFGFAYLTAYGLAVKHGYRGTEEEWLESLHGAKGETGAAARMRFDAERGVIQWGVEDAWYDLFTLEELKDPIVEELMQEVRTALEDAEAAASHAADSEAAARGHAKTAADGAANAQTLAGQAYSAAQQSNKYALEALGHREAAEAAAKEAKEAAANLPQGGANGPGQNLSLDTTLTQSGKAADAKAVGDALDKLEEKIPTKPEDIGAQPKGNYLTSAPVTSVNGKTGAVQLSAEQVGADPKGTAAAAVSAHNTNNAAHSDIRQEIKAIREQLADFLDVDEETLNELSELIARIVANQTSIEQLTTGKVSVSDIINDLTTNVTNRPLSAAQGVVIKGLIDGLSTGKLDASKLSEAINTALAQAKDSGEFDGGPGKDGYTPQIGKDYWTPTDKAEIEAYIASELAKRGQLKPEFANSIEECTDTTRLYVLPDGYIYAYMLTEREVSTGGGYTNLAKTFAEGYRISASSGLSAQAGATAVEDYIPVNAGDTVRIKGFGAMTDWHSGFYNEDKVVQSAGKLNAQEIYGTYAYDSSTGVASFTLNNTSNIRFMRFSGILTGTTADVVITVNEEITEGGTETITEYAWANTGHAFVPADYEARIIELEEDVLQLKNTVGTQGGSTGEAVMLPAYWEPEVEAKAAIVKAHQEAGGKNCVSFVHAADLHIDDNDNGRTTDIGKVMAAMLDRCHIPWTALSGDINTRASYGTEAGLLEAQSAMPEHLAPLWGTDRLLLGLGNHDGCWGDSAGYYRHQFTQERMWNIFFRWQALDSRRVFSDDGLYFYADNVAQKTRFVVLNSNFGGEYAEDDNGWAVNNRFATSCYGQAQLDWLADVALDMPDGYGAVLCGHVPPNITYTVDRAQLIGIVDAYNGRTQFSGDYATGVDGWSNSIVSVDFSGAKGEIIAMFTGHVHGDSIDTTTMSCPIITVLSAGAPANEPYKADAPTRTPGTATETSFDVVTINRKSRTIYCTRVGAGDDREVSY